MCLSVVAFVVAADSCSSSLQHGPRPAVDPHESIGSVDAAASSAVEAGRSSVPPPPEGWNVVFQDGFDFPQIDAASWTIENRAATNMGASMALGAGGADAASGGRSGALAAGPTSCAGAVDGVVGLA